MLCLSNLIGLIWTCQKGCLLCRQSTCVICDNKNNFYKVGDICTQKMLDFCLESFDGEKCQECEDGYYIDFQNQKCVGFPNEKREVSNCKTFRFEKECVSCKSGFFLINGNCQTVEKAVDKCISYSDPKTCSGCDKSMLSDDGKQCLPFEDSNCMFISTIQCIQCKTNYILYMNKYLHDFNTWDTNKLKKYNIYKIENPYYSVCVALNVANCTTYESFSSCRVCNDGYFRNPNGLCSLLPEEPIQSCFEYQTQNVCIQCLEGYYIKSLSECEPHGLKISLCEKMSMETKDLCNECTEGYFLDSNSCVQRILVINQCKTLDLSSDQCSVCEDGYTLNDNNTLCLVQVNYCATYSKTIDNIECIDCITGYYYHKEGRCAKVANPISGCEKYKSNQDFIVDSATNLTYHCVKCQDKYYMESLLCKPHTNDIVVATKCFTFSQVEKDLCDSCSNSELKFSALNYCTQVTEVNKDNNCEKYNSSGECEACNQGYYLIEKKCLKITIENCNQASSVGKFCTQCVASTLENFHISYETSNNHCNFSHAHIIHDCVTTDSVSTNANSTEKFNTNVCPECSSPYYPTTFDKTVKFCVPKSKINFNYGSSPINDNCNIYEPISKVCRECSFNSILTVKRVIDNQICSNSCAEKFTTANVKIPRTIKIKEGDQFFKCSDTISVPNCAIEKGLGCYRCNEGYWPLIDGLTMFQATTYANSVTYDYIPAFYGNHFKTKSLSYTDPFNKINLFASCKQVVSSAFLNHNPELTNVSNQYQTYILATDYSATGNLMKKCRFALETTLNEVKYYGCGACKWGTNGFYLPVAYGAEFAYYISDCSLMSTCDVGVYYEGLGNTITNSSLNAWVSCHQCVDTTKIGMTHSFYSNTCPQLTCYIFISFLYFYQLVHFQGCTYINFY